MHLFDELIDASDTIDTLNEFLEENIRRIIDFRNGSYVNIYAERESIENFIHAKGGIFRELDYTRSYNNAFIIVLFDICERFGGELVVRIDDVIQKHEIIVGSRLEGARLYLLNVRKNKDLTDRFERICEYLLLALDEEDDDRKIIATFVNYIAKVLSDTRQEFVTILVNKIKKYQAEGTYSFLNHSIIKKIVATDLSNKEHAYPYLQKLIEILFDRAIISIPRLDSSIITTFIESDTNYCTELKTISTEFQTIRSVSVRNYMSLPTDVRNACFQDLRKGVKILDSENELFTYMHALSMMHNQKLTSAFEVLPADFFTAPISIIDWACGQGLGAISYLDYLNRNGIEQDITSITLIEPSRLALLRAGLHVSMFNKLADLRTLNTFFDALVSTDFDNIPKSRCKIHFFSNIIDVDSVLLDPLTRFIESNFPGPNFFICVSPFINPFQTSRLDSFMNFFASKPNFQLLATTNNPKGQWINGWSRVMRVFAVNL